MKETDYPRQSSGPLRAKGEPLSLCPASSTFSQGSCFYRLLLVKEPVSLNFFLINLIFNINENEQRDTIAKLTQDSKYF